jgi:hypothetical protein
VRRGGGETRPVPGPRLRDGGRNRGPVVNVNPGRRAGDGARPGRHIGRGGKRYDRRHVRRYGRHFSWGPGISFWFYDGYYYGDCTWLRRRAIATGSNYWWRRYRQCRAW